MRAGLFAVAAAGLALELAVGLRPGVARTLEASTTNTLTCRYLERGGYYKFSPLKPSGKLPLPFALQINEGLRKIEFTSGGTSSSIPYYVVEDEFRFAVKVKSESERFRVNAKTLQFQTMTDTRRSFMRHSGVCEVLPL
jgi:hypothetical protein